MKMFSVARRNDAPSLLNQTVSRKAGQASRRAPSIPSIISDDLVIEGMLTSAGELQIDGSVHGDVRSEGLTVGETGLIKGDVLAAQAIVRGKIFGNIRAREVRLGATGHVQGDIIHNTLAMEIGAFFEGNCRHANDPLSDNPIGALRPEASRTGTETGTNAPLNPTNFGGAQPTLRPQSK